MRRATFSVCSFCVLFRVIQAGVACEGCLPSGIQPSLHGRHLAASEIPLCSPKSPCLEDLVSAQTAAPDRYPMIGAGGATWRKGMRSLIVTQVANATEEGTTEPPEGFATPDDIWFSYPDRGPFAPAIASLRLAHSSFNTTGYSWMLVGDDDTVFVTQNVLRMLRGLQLDPSVPYILTDDQGNACHHRDLPAALSCVVPGVPVETRKVVNGTGTCVLHPNAAPCTTKVLEAPQVCVPGPQGGDRWFSGGSGAILSRGLFEAVGDMRFFAVEASEDEKARMGEAGEGHIADFFWDAGYGITNPSLTNGTGEERGAYKKKDMPHYRCRFGRNEVVGAWEQSVQAALHEDQQCDHDCRFLLTEAVSLHLRHHISDSAKSGVKAAALSVHLAEKIRILYPDIVKARSKLLDKIGEEAAMRLKMATSDEWRPKDNIARPVAAAAAGEKQAEPQLVHHGGDGGRGPGRRRRLLR